MRGVVGLLKRFASDERGNFLVIFGVMAIAVIATSGAVVDFASIQQARARAQQALDSAALGLQPTIYDTPTPSDDALRIKAQALLTERLDDPSIDATVDSANKSIADGTLHLEASIVVPTAFVRLVGIDTVRATLVSEATRKRLAIEVAMVLDNSLSMKQQSRMDNLKTAAKCAENILLNGDCDSIATSSAAPTVKIGIVPFTSFVNVGTSNKTAAWMDQTGTSDFANDNFDSDDNDTNTYSGNVNRFTLFNNIRVNWGGCVEARKYPYDTDDTTPVASNPDTLFTPAFAPDNPDAGGYSNNYLNDQPSACKNNDAGTWDELRKKTGCGDTWSSRDRDSKKLDTYDDCGSTQTTSRTSTKWDGTSQTAAATQPATMPDKNGNPLAAVCQDQDFQSETTGTKNSRTYTLSYHRHCSYSFTDRVLQERLCKYTGTASTSSGKGPNQDCPNNALTDLTNTKSTITAAINAMSPQGFTNIHQGAIWGFHMLSPTAPLTTAAAFGTATYKVMILMTDGENTIDDWRPSNMNGSGGYTAYGYPWNNPTSTTVDCDTSNSKRRIQSTTYSCPSTEGEYISAQNNRLAETCENAKDAGITIYTVGLATKNTSDPTGNTTLLTNCASGADHAYFPDDPEDLTDVFETIATQLANLRLAR
jgi:Flp pilus assembly protein TadG